METNQLKSFVHIAELGSLSKAADRLKIAQPALSRQMRLLEAELGAPLFDRHGRGMALTQVGRKILAEATAVLVSMDRIRAVAALDATDLRGKVTIGMPPTISEIVTVPLVRILQERFPNLRLQIVSAFSGHILEWLKRGEIDLSVSYDAQAQGSIRTQPVMIETLHLVQRDTPAGTRITYAEMTTRNLILPSRRHGLRILLDEIARRVGLSLDPVIEAESLTAMLDLVRAGFGSAVLPLASLQQSARGSALHTTNIVDPTPTRRVVIAYPIDRQVTPAALAAGAAFREIARDLISHGAWAGKLVTDTEPS